MTMKDDLRMLEQRRAKALAMGSSSRLKEFHEAGVLNVRERIDYLLMMIHLPRTDFWLCRHAMKIMIGRLAMAAVTVLGP